GNTLHITTVEQGGMQHSVQIVQADIPVAKGAKYELRYDAYAGEARTMVTNITAPDRGYFRYLADTKVSLTTEKQTFTHRFDMTEYDDANARVEFNLGRQGSTATVHISNVTLKRES
ncbi:MAG: carbohydrate binding domain-containing protein, partial [Lachnospiraceae bacterium]|nr:carbohydrate binding domain-containing protein [Lachnospiraceae bacterium]